MARTQHDPGLRAVARVREVRERDSRLGLQHALREVAVREAELARLENAVAAHSNFVSGDAAEFVALRASLMALRFAVAEARARAEAAASVAIAAQAHWQADKSRLGAVEGLLERRAEERAADRARDEAKQLDDVASQRWLAENRGSR